MRFVKPLVGFILVMSLFVNLILYVKVLGRRAIVSVNGMPLTKADVDTHLEQQYGAQYKAQLIMRMLIDQEAHAQAVAPTDQEVDEEFNTKKELDWAFANNLEKSPNLIDEAKSEIKQGLEQENLLTRDVTVSEEDVRDEYKLNPGAYDTPNKARCKVAAIINEDRTDDIRKMLAANEPPMNPNEIKAAYPGDVAFLGDGGVFTFVQPFGSEENKDIFTMDAKTVRVIGPPSDLTAQGIRKLIVRLDSLIPGHKADLTDPKIIKKIKQRIALRRCKPLRELYSTLWLKSNIVFEDPSDRIATERLIFPEKTVAPHK